MKRKTEKILIPLIVISVFLPNVHFEKASAEEETSEFEDIQMGGKHYIAINYLKSLGLIQGYEDNTFKSGEKINRAEAIKMIALACGLKADEPEPAADADTTNTPDIAPTEPVATTEQVAPFSDTPLDAWYTPYLILAKEKGIISGYSDGSFKPDQNVNLAEVMKIYFECTGNINYPEDNKYLYDDTPSDSWFAKYAKYASLRNLLDINLDNNAHPDQEISRGYLAEIIYRNLLSNDGYEFGKATYYGLAVQGHNTASGKIFDMNAMTAAHKTLPFGTMVEATNLANGKMVTVEITDRGPYGAGRVLDLSSGAFEQLASLGAGVINVGYKILPPQ